MLKFTNLKKNNGFTLIELLIVVGVIGALAVVTINIFNLDRTKGIARDGVRRSHLGSLSTGIEAYRAIEGQYPTVAEYNDSDSVLRTTYLNNIPQSVDDETGTTLIYEYVVNGNQTEFLISIPNTGGMGYYKYYSEWSEIRDCSLPASSTDCTP